MDQLLLDAKRLASRLREHNASSDTLIDQANNLHLKLDAMKQYRDVVSDLNEVAHHRPRSTLILGSQEENARIRELQQENIELQTSVAEYQSALELIMAKYREQVFGLIKANRLDATCMKLNNYKELQAKTEQICEMAAVMAEAIHIDDQAIQQEQERLVSIESENKGLRELLKISGITAPVKEEEASPKQNTPEEDTSSTTTD
ncbi:FGFR1 oncogene partner 2 homolog [Montipora capricornis]|uniref:FGFR1 oncogene partner 2 homolog n=1 Tax=Montipora foliosa TaxID=591990 RepID=UPI0035F1E97B